MKLLENRKLKIGKLNSGFTLLELLVVIAIIGILVSLGVVSYTTAQQRSRNAKRIGDLESIQDSFEQYYVIEGTYSTTCSDMDDSLIGGLPSDPLTGVSYVVNANCSDQAYCACAALEGQEGNATSDSPDTTCSFGSGNFYCVSNLQ